MNKMTDLIKLEECFINKPVLLELHMNDLDDYEITIEGKYVDVIGASYDLINTFISDLKIFPKEHFIFTLLNHGEVLKRYIKKQRHIVNKAYIIAKLDENQHANLICKANNAESLLLLVKLAEKIAEKYDISYKEYVNSISFYENKSNKVVFDSKSMK